MRLNKRIWHSMALLGLLASCEDGVPDATRDAALLDGSDGEGGANGEPCPEETVYAFDGEMWDGTTGTRVSLDLVCDEMCEASISEMAWECRERDPDSDAEWEIPYWRRVSGCGRVEYFFPGHDVTVARSRYVFDADTEDLIGSAEYSDVGLELGGAGCVDSVFVGGEVPPLCEDAVVEYCRSAAE